MYIRKFRRVVTSKDFSWKFLLQQNIEEKIAAFEGKTF